jgi:putative ABC transport system permease protein
MKLRNFVDDIWSDLRYAARLLRRSPGFTAVAIITLALGIGATTAIFSVINTVLLQPLPYPQPDRLVQLALSAPQGKGVILSVPEYMEMGQATKALQDFTLYDFRGPGINLTGGDRPEQLKGIRASADYFQLFGATVVVGRPFSADEDRPGGPHVAVISYGLWQSRFGGSRDVVGRTIELGGAPFVVTGVVSRDFRPDPPLDIWLPLQANPDSKDMAHYLLGAARLKPGVTLSAANSELALAAAAYQRKFPRTMPPKATFAAIPMQEIQVANIRPMLLILLGAVAFVLLISCDNVANLLLARATLRRREIAIRAAVGAGRGRIIRQLLTESVLLSLGGGAVGLVLGFVGVRALLAINPGHIPRIGENGAAVALDWHVLLFTLVVAVLTGILFGLIPALNASRSDLQSTLKESGARQGTGFRHNKSRSILVVTEVALALVLLAGAALLIRTLYAMRMVNPGFDPHNVLTMEMSLTGPRFEKTAGVAAVIRQAEQQVGSFPGVVAVSMSSSLPLAGQYGLPFNIVGRPLTGKSPFTGGAEWAPVSPEFFKVFRIPIRQGRAFTDLDDSAAPGAVIINEAFAKRYWPKGNPVGQQMIIGKGVGPEFAEPARLIVGVVGDVHDGGLNRNPPDIMYIPIAQMTDGVTALTNQISPMRWAVRTHGAPYTLRAAIQEKLRDASGGLPVAHFETMDQRVEESTAGTDFNMVLLSIFAGVALLLAGIGIYGLIAYSVEQRTQEIGIRMALGAQSQDVRKMVVRQGMLLALIGVAIGVGAALGLTRLMASMLFGVKAWNPFIYITVAVLLSLIAFAATYIPARRAAQVDPMVALRYE